MSKVILSAIFFLIFTNLVFSQKGELLVNEYTVEDGISQSVPTALLQDNFGFIWIGTEDGLNRFDGYSFDHFFNDPLDSNSLCHNFITALMQDSRDKIWVGTRNGLSIYDPIREIFHSFNSSENDSSSLNNSLIFSLFESSLGEIFVGTSTGLNIAVDYNGEISSVKFRRVITTIYPDSLSIISSSVMDIKEDENNFIWLALQAKDKLSGKDVGSLTRYNSNENKFEHFYLNDNENFDIKSSAIRSIYCQDNLLWVGTFSEGLIELELNNKKFPSVKRIFNTQRHENRLAHDYISKITMNDEQIFIGTYNGLSVLNLHDSTISDVRLFNKKREPLQPSGINDLLLDESSNLWIASDKGLFRFSPSSKNFQTFINNPKNDNSIIGGDIFGIKEDSNGTIWASSYGSGINKITSLSGGQYKVERITAGNNGLSTNQILRIEEDFDNNIWFSTFNGIFKIKNNATGEIKFENFTSQNSELTSIYYYDLFFHAPNKFVARTYQSGIDLISVENGLLRVKNYKYTFSNEQKDKIISCFSHEHNELWLVTNNSIVLGKLTETFELEFIKLNLEMQYWEKISKLMFFYFLRPDANTLLIGTNNGLLKLSLDYSLEKSAVINVNDIKIYNINNGLPNNSIYAIARHNENSFWLSTNKGLSRFSLEDESFTNYEISSGINLNEFNAGTVEVGKYGHIYFGGIGGFIKFHPDSLFENHLPPPVVINEIKLFNEPLKTNSILTKSILYTDVIEFSYMDNMITLGFSALNFDEPDKNSYLYILEGFQKDWVNAGKIRYATFTNLDDGEYTFRVKAANKTGVGGNEGASIKLIINPPPWKTWWAYLLYASLVISGFIFLLWTRERKYKRALEIEKKIEAAKSEERKKVRTKISQDFHDEAGNKITKINLFTTLAQRKTAGDFELKSYLDKIQENTKELSFGMRDFLWVLDVGKDSLFDMLKRIEDFGNSMFEMTEIKFKVNGIEDFFEKISMPMHARRALIFIFKEALNNSIKYSVAGSVIFTASLKDNLLTLTLEDDGKGFIPSDSSEGYGLKNMKHRAEKLNGKIEITSAPEQGTKIMFEGNLTQMGN